MQNGDRVTWKEGGYGQYTCTGTIVCNRGDNRGRPTDFFTIKVDDEHLYRACHTASEMHLGWVDRSVDLNKLSLLVNVEQ